MGTIAERAWAEVDLGAIAHNFRYAQVRVGTSVGVLAVVKSNAYGHGAVPVAREVEHHGAKAIGVATPGEAIELREAGIQLPVLVMGSCLEEEVEPAVAHGVSLSLSPRDILWPIIEAAKKLGKCAHVHLLVDTGMSRDGLAPSDAIELAEHVRDSSGVHLEGTYTHLATSSQPDKTFAHEQLNRFKQVIGGLLARNIHPGLVHCANSGGLFTLPSAHFDMVRQGITLYGMVPSEHVGAAVDLMPAMSVKTRVMAVRDIAPGDSVGYYRSFVAARPTRLATIAMGYSDGLRLGLSNKGQVLINGRRAPVVGRVMMDCTVVDVTSLPGVRLGDEAVIIGKSGRNRITAADVAALCDSSAYEVMCSFGRRVKRIYTRNGKRIIAPDTAQREHADEASRVARPADTLSP